MKVTKYPQSCLLVEGNEGRILIDPGNYALDVHSIEDFGRLDAVLYTHRHADHFDDRLVDQLREQGTAMYGNDDVTGLIGEGCTTLADAEQIDVAGFTITARDLPHVEMVDGSPGPPNTGFLIDDRLFHPGDGIDIELQVDNLALPITGPSISFRDAYRFVERSQARQVVPIHYDAFIADPDRFAQNCDIAKVLVLRNGESAEL